MADLTVSDVKVREGLRYCNRDGADLCGDLYLPAGNGPFPVLVGAPGGAWRMCARASLKQWGFYLAAHGYAFYAIDYRVASATRKAFPEAAQDVAAAVRFVRGTAAELDIDPERIGLLGTSAGAHLAALVALADNGSALLAAEANDPHASVASGVKTLVAAYGIYDLARQWEDDLALNPGPDGNVARNLIGKDPFEDQQAFFDASPLRHISYKKNKMTVLVTWGAADEFVSPAQSERFVRALQQARFNVRTHRLTGASHFWFAQPLDIPSSDSAIFAPRLLQFLKMAL